MNTKTLLYQDLEREFGLTLALLKRIPEAHFSWKPHEKSTSLGQLASHVATLPRLMLVVLQEQELDFSKTPPRAPQPIETQETLVNTAEQMHHQVLEGLQAVDETYLLEPWLMRNGDTIILKGNRVQAIRWLGLHHLIHHRAELIVYLRLLNISVPGLYGPSADEPPVWMLRN
ncbi:MAG: DinB family protein [Thermoflavifilum sp.]|nr:DinB family protein [Thermoflavifilum sp.]